jgi:hypothetical protein
MGIWDYSRSAFGICAAAAMLAGCGGSQPSIGTPGATPRTQTSAIATQGEPAGSWMLPEAKSGDLLYVAVDDSIEIFTYPGLKEVTSFNPGLGGLGEGAANHTTGELCFSDGGPFIWLFSHGGEKPFAMLLAPGSGAFNDCAFNPTDNDIAASYESDGGGCIAIYHSPSGSPTLYSATNIGGCEWLAYDGSGDLYVDGLASPSGFGLGELPAGGNQLIALTLDKRLKPVGSLQWDGQYMTMAVHRTLYRFTTSGSSVRIVSHVTLQGMHFNKLQEYSTTYDLLGSRVIAPIGRGPRPKIGFWQYPAGGKSLRVLQVPKPKKGAVGDALSSVAPSQPNTQREKR